MPIKNVVRVTSLRCNNSWMARMPSPYSSWIGLVDDQYLQLLTTIPLHVLQHLIASSPSFSHTHKKTHSDIQISIDQWRHLIYCSDWETTSTWGHTKPPLTTANYVISRKKTPSRETLSFTDLTLPSVATRSLQHLSLSYFSLSEYVNLNELLNLMPSVYFLLFKLVINEIDSSAASPLQAVKLLALYLSSSDNKVNFSFISWFSMYLRVNCDPNYTHWWWNCVSQLESAFVFNFLMWWTRNLKASEWRMLNTEV